MFVVCCCFCTKDGQHMIVTYTFKLTRLADLKEGNMVKDIITCFKKNKPVISSFSDTEMSASTRL